MIATASRSVPVDEKYVGAPRHGATKTMDAATEFNFKISQGNDFVARGAIFYLRANICDGSVTTFSI